MPTFYSIFESFQTCTYEFKFNWLENIQTCSKFIINKGHEWGNKMQILYWCISDITLLKVRRRVKHHITTVCDNVAKVIRILHKRRWYLPSDTLKTL